MKTSLYLPKTIFYISLFSLVACEKDPGIREKGTLQATVVAGQVYELKLNACGDEESARILSAPKHAELSEIIRNAQSDFCPLYRYRSKKDFRGTERMVLETCTGGAITCTQLDTIVLQLQVVRK